MTFRKDGKHTGKELKGRDFMNHSNPCLDHLFDDQYVDKDLEELVQADMQSVRKELSSYGYDLDKVLDRLLVDLSPEVIKLHQVDNQKDKRRVNQFIEAFQVIQEAVLESLYTTREQYFWQRKPVVRGSLAFGFLLLVLSSFWMLAHFSNIFPSTKLVSPDSKALEMALIVENLSSEEKEQIAEALNHHVLSGGKVEASKEMNMLLTELLNNKSPTLKNYSKVASIRNICSNNGFYSHIIKEGDTISSISQNCGFVYSGFNEMEDLPILNISDVAHFNFDGEQNLMKLTVYKDESFHILDFEKGKFISKSALVEEDSIIVEVDLRKSLSIYEGLKENLDLKGRGDLWKKVVNRLSKDYSGALVRNENQAITKFSKYYVNIKYRHNEAKNYYEVVSTSLLPVEFGG